MAVARPLVIGIGNPFAGDDAAGRLVARRLAETVESVDVAQATGMASEIIALFEGRERVFIIDACHSGCPPGSLHRFDAREGPLPAGLSNLSTHGVGLTAAIELARALGGLPPNCIVYAIEGECFDLGAEVSSSVSSNIERLVERVTDEINRGSA